MNVHDLKNTILAAVEAKEKSDDPTFAQMLQREIESLLSQIISVMGKSLDDLKDEKKVPHKIEELATLLHECHAM